MLVLASGSPRRREILAALGLEFEIVVPDVAELDTGEPRGVVLENARLKAAAGRESAPPGATVIAADTEVFLDGVALGQPQDVEGARRRLRALADRDHTVLTGLVLLDGDPPRERSGVAETAVSFGSLSEEVLGAYLDSGEWRGRAGAYAVQGLGSSMVVRVDGDVSNVIGLPVRLLHDLAAELFARNA